MQRLLLLIYLLCLIPEALGKPASESWSTHIKHRLQQIWHKGDIDLYLSGYAWHNRYFYEPERIPRYNELAWGGGLGKEFYDEDGDQHNLFAIAFLDSHKNVEPVVGYTFLKVAKLSEKAKIGLGYALLVTSRSDIMHGVPFPGILPWASVHYGPASIGATYIPGTQNIGNVLFVFGKWRFDKA